MVPWDVTNNGCRVRLAGIARQRLACHGLSTSPFPTPEDVVLWLGAVQSQEYALAKWSVAQRCTDTTHAAVERALADGTILRTHVLRPTWHFVHQNDIRWLLELTGPRVQAMARYRHRQLGIDDAILRKSCAALAVALDDGNHLTRREIADVLRGSGIATDGQILVHLLMDAELEGVVCSGVPRGKQQTYALLDARAPHSSWLPRDEALAELTARYFRSRGPATLKDFQWWSSLSASELKRGIEIVGAELETITLDGRTYWCDPARVHTPEASPTVHLIQEYDEYLVAYSDSRGITDLDGLLAKGESLARAVIIDGQVAGRWRRPAGRGTGEIVIDALRPLAESERGELERAMRRTAEFLADVPPVAA